MQAAGILELMLTAPQAEIWIVEAPVAGEGG